MIQNYIKNNYGRKTQFRNDLKYMSQNLLDDQNKHFYTTKKEEFIFCLGSDNQILLIIRSKHKSYFIKNGKLGFNGLSTFSLA